MKKLKSYEIRQMWLDFFASKGHSVEPSANLIPVNDKGLLWINAGVAPLKKYFDGSVIPNNPRMTNAQKCIRTNDIDNVGKTARHHTFFEMLGNFSIGDYFKETAIEYGFELLTSKEYFDFDIDKLYMTYYPSDKIAFEKWISLGVKESHLIPLEGNFWEIGEGPCGPDTEIFYDRGESSDKRGIELLVNDIENDRYIEIWNIVFSQFNSKIGVERSQYKELPAKNIDTGCGLERLCCVMQGVDTNYETDLFLPIINKIEEISNVKYEGQMAFKVIADHVRTVTFAVSEGATLSNEGRGYVLRRVLRRATRYGRKLGINKPFMSLLVDEVVNIMKPFYKELETKKDIVKQIITKEEEKFLSTIEVGEKRFEQLAKNAVDNKISGEDAFTLYDTFGFPFELTLEYASELSLEVNKDEFDSAMNLQKQRARSSRKENSDMNIQNEDFINFKEESNFVGYTLTDTLSKVIAIFDDLVVLDKTPFYATSGGQVCDMGTIDGINVLDVFKMPNGQHIHQLENHSLKLGDSVHCAIDLDYRSDICKNHSSAHLVQKALQTVVGSHVHQQGSYVSDEICRFDFNSYNNLTDEEILKVEDLVNEYILQANVCVTEVMSLKEAMSKNVMALFDDKYKDEVRVVNLGDSHELCGGTHVKNTSDIVNFNIISVESIGSGIFRLTATTGLNAKDNLIKNLSNSLSNYNDIISKGQNIKQLAINEGIALDFNYESKYTLSNGYRLVLQLKKDILDIKEIVKNLDLEYNNQLSRNALKSLDTYKSLIKNNAIITRVDVTDSNILKDMASSLLNNNNLDLVMLVSDSDKLTFVCATSSKYDAVKYVRIATSVAGGGGGGKPTLAQAGGKDKSKVSEALAKVEESL